MWMMEKWTTTKWFHNTQRNARTYSILECFCYYFFCMFPTIYVSVQCHFCNRFEIETVNIARLTLLCTGALVHGAWWCWMLGTDWVYVFTPKHRRLFSTNWINKAKLANSLRVSYAVQRVCGTVSMLFCHILLIQS